MTTPANDTPAPVAAPRRQPESTDDGQSSTMWKWIGGALLVLLLILTAFWFFKPVENKTDEVAKLRQELLILQSRVQNDTTPPTTSNSTAPAVVDKETIVLDTNAPKQSVQAVKNYRRENGGAVIREIGPPVRRQDGTWYPLFNQKGRKGAITEVYGSKSPEQIQENMAFEGIKPSDLPAGQLAVFDVVKDQAGNAYQVYAWKAK